MKKFCFLLGFLVFNFLLSAQTDTIRMYKKGTKELRYKSSVAMWYMARFDLPAPGHLKGVNLKLDGTGEGKLRIFGHEAGSPYAETEKDLIEPIIFSKNESGYGFVYVELPNAVWLDNNQFFIVIDISGSQLSLVRSRDKVPTTCSSSNGGTYYPTILAVPGQHAYYKHLWSQSDLPLIVDAIFDFPSKKTQGYLADVTEANGLPLDMSIKSVAWADYNGDDFLDLLVAGRLFKNDPSGGPFVEQTQLLGIAGAARANAFIDINNDGWDDILLFGTDNKLYINQGDGTFTESILSIPALNSISSFSIADVNGDGLPDLFVGQLWGTYPVPGTNYLFINDGNNDFKDESTRIYPSHDGETNYPSNTICDPDNSSTWLSGANRARRSRGSQFVDFDEDGDLDLFVTNYFLEQDEFYENDGTGHFKEIIENKQIDQHQTGSSHGTGVDWGDYDNDGDMDLLLSQFAHPWGVANFDHRGTTIYQNTGSPNFNFIDQKDSAGIEYEETHASAAWGDVDNDGKLDFVITTYYGCRYVELYTQKEKGKFQVSTFNYGLENIVTGEDAVWVDYDNDGRLDLCLGNENKLRLYKNVANIYSRRFLELSLVATSGNKKAIGAKVKVYANGSVYYQQVVAGRGQRMMKPLKLHFGLDKATSIQKVEVEWPNGDKEVFEGLERNRSYSLTQGGEISLQQSLPNAKVNSTNIYPNPASRVVNITNPNGIDRVDIYTTNLELVMSVETNGAIKKSINLEEFAPGIYFIRTSGAQFFTFDKVVVNQ